MDLPGQEVAGLVLAILVALLDWRNGGAVLAGFIAFFMLWVLLARLAQRAPALGLASAVSLAAIPPLLWYGTARMQMPYSLLMGLLAAGASWWMWPAAWQIARTALDARAQARAAPRADGAAVPRQAHGSAWLIAALVTELALYAADESSIGLQALLGGRLTTLLWGATSLAGAVGVMLAARSHPKLAWGRWPCALLALVPGFNLPVLTAFLLVSLLPAR